MSDADLVFLPWVRRGAAAALLDPDTIRRESGRCCRVDCIDHDQYCAACICADQGDGAGSCHRS